MDAAHTPGYAYRPLHALKKLKIKNETVKAIAYPAYRDRRV